MICCGRALYDAWGLRVGFQVFYPHWRKCLVRAVVKVPVRAEPCDGAQDGRSLRSKRSRSVTLSPSTSALRAYARGERKFFRFAFLNRAGREYRRTSLLTPLYRPFTLSPALQKMPYSHFNDLPAAIRERAAKIKLAVFDVDGVLTDGKLCYTDDGRELKSFHVHDGFGLKRLMANGIEV